MFEFMGLKIPVVAPKLMPITDVLEDSRTAILFETLDMEGLKNQLSELILDKQLRESIADSAYNLLMEKYTWHNNAQSIIDDLETNRD